MGSVDSGKTQIYHLLTGIKPSQIHGRTQEVRIHDLGSGIQLVDSPGHQLLGPYKDLALRLADLVLYVVDGARPSYELLGQISKTRPIVLIVNKWDLVSPSSMGVSLRQSVRTDQGKVRMYQLMEPYRIGSMNQGLDLKVFLDATAGSLQSSIIPLCARSGWGVELLNSWLRGMARTITVDHRRYLYRPGQALRFRPVGPVEPNDVVRMGQDTGTVSELFVEHRGLYEPRKHIRVNPQVVLLLMNPGQSRDSVETVGALTPGRQDYIRKIKVLCRDLPGFQVYIYAPQEPKYQVLRNLCQGLGWTHCRISLRAWVNFQQTLRGFKGTEQEHTPLLVLGTRDSSVMVGVQGNPYIGISNPSCISLLNLLQDNLKKIKTLTQERLMARYQYDGIVQVMTEHKFYETKSMIIVGCSLIHGKIHPGPEPLLVLDYLRRPTGHRVQITGIQQNNVSHSQWKDKGKLIALKLKFSSNLNLRQDTYYLVYEHIWRGFSQYLRSKEPGQDVLSYYQYL